ncbi:hypothetical protein KCP76_06885 [Salmonella enterica subsp. enterica serovar Weltevreden]|nr:hypothetical protein KCP76_06885 [Salmonella enterica subsp. enterica serovar Weltevreden]
MTDRTSLTGGYHHTFNGDVRIRFSTMSTSSAADELPRGQFHGQYCSRRTLVDNDFTVARFDESAAAELLRRPVP